MKMHMFFDIDSRVADIVETYIQEDCKQGDRNETGLDPRAFGGKFFYNYDCIIIDSGARRNLDYYGGFEYIDSDYIRQYGDYVIYSAEHERVQEVIDNLMEKELESEDA
jgi:hypothetical protein